MKSIGLLIAILFFAVFVGLVAGFMPWFVGVGLALALGVLAFAGRSAVLDVSLLLVIALGVVPISGRSKLDLLVLLLMLFLLARSARQVGPVLDTHKKLLSWVGAIIVIGVFSLAYGLLIRKNDIQLAYSDARFLLYWLALPVTLVLLRERMTVRALALTLTVFGTALGAIGSLQSVLGVRLLLSESGRVEALQNTLSTYSDVTRSIVPGTLLISFVFYLALARLVLNDKTKRGWWWLVLAVTTGGIITNFGRALWLTTILVSLYILIRIRSGRAVRVVLGAAVLAFIAGTTVFFVKPAFFEGVVDRVASTAEEGRTNTSWSWRKFENNFAVASILKHPELGVGMGGEYKPFQSAGLESFGELQVSYIHNSYLFLPLKLGVLGAAIILSVLIWLTIRSNRFPAGDNFSDIERAVQMAVGATMIHTMVLAYIQPQFNAFLAVLVISIVLAMAEQLRSSPALVEIARSKDRFDRGLPMSRAV